LHQSLCFTYLHSLHFFLSSKGTGTYQSNRCTFKQNIKSYIFIFSSAPCQILLSLHLRLCFRYLLKQFTIFSFFKGTYQRKRCTFKNNMKSHISMFFSAPCQIYLCLHQSLCFAYLHSLLFFFLSKVPTKEKRALSKIILNPICSRFSVRPVRFLYLYIKFCVLPTITVYNFFFQEYLSKKNVHFQKIAKIPYFHFLQCVMSDLFIFASKFVFTS